MRCCGGWSLPVGPSPLASTISAGPATIACPLMALASIHFGRKGVTDQTEDLQVPPDVDVWVFIPNLRRVRRISGALASSILTKVMQRGGAAVVVYGPDRKVKSIYLAPVEP
jgi:hypothetical protein